MAKVQVIVSRESNDNNGDQINEKQFRGRFFLVMVGNHLKILDIESYKLYDLLTE